MHSIDMDGQLFGPLATVVAASLAGFIGLITVVLSKENKVSEFRQAWIDELRKDVASLLANSLQSVRILRNAEGNVDKDQSFNRAILDANTALYMIRLRLNPDETKSDELLQTLREIEEFSAEDVYPDDRISELERKLTRQSKAVLKEEWDRVRSGELTYKLVKFGLIIYVAVFLVATIWIPWAGIKAETPVAIESQVSSGNRSP